MARDPNCIFCKIAAKEIPSQPVLETDAYIIINDINPQAPTHLLVIPRDHAKSIVEFGGPGELGILFEGARKAAAQANLKDGFRLVVNTGTDGGQTVDHLHIHVLGGRSLSWPPG